MTIRDRMIAQADPEDIAAAAESLDPEQAAAIGEALAENVDEETIARFAAEAWTSSVAPHLADIRARAERGYSREQIRRYYAAELTPDEQQETFDSAFNDILVAAFSLRAALLDGGDVALSDAVADLRELIRDPYTVEAILLIFENDEYIDPEYAEQMKEYGAWVLRSLGVALAPELYEPSTVQEIAQDHGLDMETRGDTDATGGAGLNGDRDGRDPV